MIEFCGKPHSQRPQRAQNSERSFSAAPLSRISAAALSGMAANFSSKETPFVWRIRKGGAA